jgi:glycosyltransferase involved in cell wall biosynthesis
MKVLHVYKDYYPPVKGGIECHINLLANGLTKKGVDVEVLVSNRSSRYQEEIRDGIRVFKVPQWNRFYSAPLTPTFNFYLRKFGKSSDIIHFHHPNPTAEFSYFFSNLHKKLIVTYHSDIIRQDKLGKIYSPFRKLLLEKSDRIIATSPNYIETSNVLRNFKHKCTVIPLGINIDRFRQNGNSPQISKIKNTYNNNTLILFVGCFRYYKGLEFLISAMKDVPSSLLLIGSGPEEHKLRTIVRKYQLDDKIHFLGELPDEIVNYYYMACDMFVLPSHRRSEAFGMVQLEAMCCGKPVISTELGTGTSYVNINGKTGIVVNPTDIESLSVAINYLVRNPEKREFFGKNGKSRVQEMFSAESMVDSTVKLYDKVISTKNFFYERTTPLVVDFTSKHQKTKILRVVSRLNIGGPTLNVKYLIEGLNDERFETKLISGTISPNEGDMSYITQFDRNVMIHISELQREINFFKDAIALIKILKVVLHYQPDIIHSHTSKAGTIARSAAAIYNFFTKKNTLVVHTYHGHVLEGYFSTLKTKLIFLIEKLLASVTDAIIAISHTQKWELTEKYQLANSRKVHIINLGFDLSRFLDIRGKGILRLKHAIDDHTLVIGIVGRLAPIKNHRLFLDAAKLLLAKYPNKSIKFVIIGDGELKASLKKYTQSIGIEKFVIFYGWEKKIESIYADLDILVMTSNNEGTPVSIIESMAASVPVVTTGVGGVKDLLGRIETRFRSETEFSICERGILCPKGNANAISNGIQYLVDSDNQALLEKARNFVFNNYTEKRLIKKMLELYNKLELH